MFSSALIELRQSKIELLDLMEEQAHDLLETVITSSSNALLTYEHLELFLEERLLNNAGCLKYLLEKGEMNNKLLERFAAENKIYRINIFSSSGEKKYWSHNPNHETSAGKMSPALTVKPIFSGEKDTLFIGIKQANYEEGTRFAIALAAKDRSAIVLNLNAEELLNFRRQIGFGSLLKNIAHSRSIVYLALQDTLGIIAALGNISELEKIKDSQFLAPSLTDSTFKTRILNFETLNVYEAIYPFFLRMMSSAYSDLACRWSH